MYERALAYMNKVCDMMNLEIYLKILLKLVLTQIQMPRIWTDYCQFLLDQCLITRTRKACDRALRSLPITQHHRVWPIYLKLVESFDIPDTGVKVYKRYFKV